MIAALGWDGVRAPLVFPGATDTQAFQTYVDEVLAPELRPGDVVVFDNLKPHRSPHVAESIGRAGASVLLPPYSSDYDPIEESRSKFKGELRRGGAVQEDLVQCCWRDPGPCNAPGYSAVVQPQWTVRTHA